MNMPDPKKSTLGELTTIRDILMGEQMVEYDARFHQLDLKIQELEKHIKNALDGLEKRQSDALEKLREEAMARLDALTEQLEGRAGALEHKIDTVSTSDRVRLGRMLRELGQQIEGAGLPSDG